MKPDKVLLIAAIVGILLLLFTTTTTPADLHGVVESVYDGDTLTVILASGAVAGGRGGKGVVPAAIGGDPFRSESRPQGPFFQSYPRFKLTAPVRGGYYNR